MNLELAERQRFVRIDSRGCNAYHIFNSARSPCIIEIDYSLRQLGSANSLAVSVAGQSVSCSAPTGELVSRCRLRIEIGENLVFIVADSLLH